MAQPKEKKKNNTGVALLRPEETSYEAPKPIDWMDNLKKQSNPARHEAEQRGETYTSVEPHKQKDMSLPKTRQEYYEMMVPGASEAPIVKHNSPKESGSVSEQPVSQIVITTPVVATPVSSQSSQLSPESVLNNPQTSNSGNKNAAVQQAISSELFNPNLDVPQLYKKLQAIKQVVNNGIVGGIYYNKTW